VSRAIRFEDEAEQEYRAAARWYDDQRAGLGTEFLDTVDATLAHIVRFPRAGVFVPRVPAELRVRRAPVKRFPYHIVYINLETETTIRVLAVAHDRRKPGYWKSRL
jgi:toxin ParE1/3/4